MPSDPRPLPDRTATDTKSVATALHRLLDILALLVVKELEKERIEQEKYREETAAE
jgi:hypothetical protein